MKNRITICVLLTFSFLLFSFKADFLTGIKEKNDLAIYNLKGKVKAYTDMKYNAIEKQGKIQKGELQAKYMLHFNDSGNMIDYFWYAGNGTIERKEIFKYDEKWRLSQEDRYDGMGKLSRKITYEYQTSGNRKKNYFKSDGSSDGYVITEYDKEENKIVDEAFSAEGSSEQKATYKYDKSGNITEEKNYGADGKITSKSVCTYDSKGNKTEEDTYNPDGSKYSKELCVYDEQGNMIEHTLYGGHFLFTINDLFYNYTYTYVYDANGNWTKKTEFENGEIPKNITEREITYY